MRSILIVILLVFLLACNSSKKELKNSIQLFPDKIELKENGSIKYDDLIEEMEAIRLETNDACRIAKVTQLVCTKQRIIIWDSRLKKLLAFSNTGKFLNEIGSNGKGPKEYVGFTNFWVSELDHCIKIYDGSKKRILFYDFDGKFLKRIPIGYFALQFGEFSNGDYWAFVAGIPDSKNYGEDKELKFVTFSKEGRVTNEIFGEPYDGPNYFSSFSVHQNDQDELLYTEVLDYSIKKFNGDRLQIKQNFSFPGFECTQSLKDRFKADKHSRELHKELLSNYILGMMDLLENEDYLYFLYPYKKQILNVFLSKKTGKLKTYKGVPMDDSSWKTVMLPKFCDHHYWYSSIDAFRFENYKEMKIKNWSCPIERKNSIDEKFKNLNSNQNPIIIKYALKEF